MLYDPTLTVFLLLGTQSSFFARRFFASLALVPLLSFAAERVGPFGFRFCSLLRWKYALNILLCSLSRLTLCQIH